jgi:hypothetical protein
LKSKKALQAGKAIAHVTGVYRARSCIVLKKVHILPYSAPRIMHNQTDEDPVGNGDQTSDCQLSRGVATEQRAGRRNDNGAETLRSQLRQYPGAAVGRRNCATGWILAWRAGDEASGDGGGEQ